MRPVPWQISFSEFYNGRGGDPEAGPHHAQRNEHGGVPEESDPRRPTNLRKNSLDVTLVAVTQRVIIDSQFNCRYDALDQGWNAFLKETNLEMLIIPNNPTAAFKLITSLRPDGLLLTGGNNLSCYAGDAPERDELEVLLLQWAIKQKKPVLGVCRGMQLIQNYFSIALSPIENHVQQHQSIFFKEEKMEVNSYHCYGTTETSPELTVLATSADGIVKAIQHKNLPIYGIMWHPERMKPFRFWDIKFFNSIFDERLVRA